MNAAAQPTVGTAMPMESSHDQMNRLRLYRHQSLRSLKQRGSPPVDSRGSKYPPQTRQPHPARPPSRRAGPRAAAAPSLARRAGPIFVTKSESNHSFQPGYNVMHSYAGSRALLTVHEEPSPPPRGARVRAPPGPYLQMCNRVRCVGSFRSVHQCYICACSGTDTPTDTGTSA
eukprot:COSAG02_NODE_765_length_17396_cov_16.796786_6_plen_173_part_00